MRCVGGLLLAFASSVLAEDARTDHRREMARLAREERAFWENYQRRANEAEDVFRRPWSDPAPGTGAKARYGAVCDHSAYRRLYEDCAAIEAARGAADLAFARTGDVAAAGVLFDALLDLAKDVDSAEAEIAKGNPAGGWGAFLQRPAIRRHCLAVREVALVEALAAAKGAAPFLATEGYASAARSDGSRSLVRRVAVIDALGMSRDPAARPFLESMLGAEETYLRIAALEALSRYGADAVAALRPLLEDRSPIVQRALLDAIRSRMPDVPAWIGPVLAHCRAAAGQERADAVATLAALTNQRFGDDTEAWQAWHERNRPAIEAGTFRRSEAPVEEASTRAPKAAITFYGVSSASRSVIFALDGTENLLVPADCEVQVTRHVMDWPFGKQDWKDLHATHEAVQLAELRKCLDAMPDDAAFGALMVKESAGLKTLPLKPATRVHRKAAIRFLETHAPRGWRSELENLAAAMEMAGLAPQGLPRRAAPAADTVFLVCDGSFRGGRYILPEATLAAFRRLNRFRRVTVHVIQICDVGAYGEEFLRQLASSSGGTYLRIRKAPD